MSDRRKQGSTPPSRPEPPWIPAAVLGWSMSALAAGAMTLGASIAISKAITGKAITGKD